MTDSDSSYGGDAVAGIAGKIVGLVGGYATLWLLTDMLTDAGYGGYVAALAVVSLLSLVAQIGLRQATIQRVGELRVTEGQDVFEYIGAAVAWVTIASLVLMTIVLAASLLLVPFVEPTLLRWVRLLVLVLPGMVLISICDGILRGFEQIPAAITLRQIAVQMLRLIGLAIVWVFWREPTGIVIVIAISHYLPIIVLAVRTRGWKYLNFTGIHRSHIRFSGYLLANSIAGRFLEETDILLLATLATLAETGGYGVAWKIAIVGRYVESVLTNTFQPRISKYLANNELINLKDEYDQVRDITVIGATTVLLLIIIFGEQLLGLFGDYTSQYSVLVILATGAVISGMFGKVGQILIMGKQGRALLLNTLVGLGGNIGFNTLLIPRYGTVGAAIATVSVYYLTKNIIAVFEVKYLMNLNTIDYTTLFVSSMVLFSTFVFLIHPSITKNFVVLVGATAICFLLYRQRHFIQDIIYDMIKKS